MALFALGLLLPLQSYFIAQSTLFTQPGITDTRIALVIPYTAMGLSLAVYLLKVCLDALPEELFDAARIDGAGDWRVFRELALPLLRPGLATVAIFSALSAWNEFLLALLYIEDDALKTIPAGPLAFSTRDVTDHSLLFAALSIVTILMIVIYMGFNRQIIEGLRPAASRESHAARARRASPVPASPARLSVVSIRHPCRRPGARCAQN